MPVIISYDLQTNSNVTRNRIQSFFERLGWERLGGSSYRYPKLATDQPMEDWFNHVVPALMLFRTFALKQNIRLMKFTLDVQSSTGFNRTTNFGVPALAAANVDLHDPDHPAFGELNLRQWLGAVADPYP